MSITQKYCSLVTNNLIVSVASNHECLILAHVTLCKASRCYGPRSSHFGTQTVTVATPTSAAGFHDSEKKRLVKHGPASSFYSYVMCRGFHIISILIFLAIVKDMTIQASRGQRSTIFVHTGERAEVSSGQHYYLQMSGCCVENTLSADRGSRREHCLRTNRKVADDGVRISWVLGKF